MTVRLKYQPNGLSKFLRIPESSIGPTPVPDASVPMTSIGIVPELSDVRAEQVNIQDDSRVVYHTDPCSPGADRFRFLRMRLRELWKSGNLRRVVITSALPGDGKSTIALNLATALAEGGKRATLLIEGDLHSPTLAHSLGLQAGPGIAECLEDGLDPLLVLRRMEPLGWYLLQAGKPRGNPTELLQSDSLQQVMQRLAPYFDWILIDTPPVIPLTDALSLSRHADGSLLVVRAGRTPREAVEEALRLLGPKHTLGIILNAAEGLNRLYSRYYGYYRGKRESQQPAFLSKHLSAKVSRSTVA